jgi:hypothetical protein
LDNKENRNGKDPRKDRNGLHLQLHEGRLPLQSLHLQELQLLTQAGPRLSRRRGPG